MQELYPIEWAVRPIKHYADFNGRASRAEYWWFYLLTIVLGIPLSLADKALGTHDVLSTVLNLALFVPWLAVTVRRLHDTNRCGGWLLALVAVFAIAGVIAVGAFGGLMPESTAIGLTGLIIVGLLMVAAVATFLAFMVLPGTEGPNNYGPDPYGPNALEEVFA